MRAQVGECCRTAWDTVLVSEPRPFALWKVCYFGLMVVLAALLVFVLIGAALGWLNPIS
jgi:hypothetical protein